MYSGRAHAFQQANENRAFHKALNDQLWEAIREHNLEAVEQAVRQGVSLNHAHWQGTHPLEWAVSVGRQPLVQTLVTLGARWDVLSIHRLWHDPIRRDDPEEVAMLVALGAPLPPAELWISGSSSAFRVLQWHLQRLDDADFAREVPSLKQLQDSLDGTRICWLSWFEAAAHGTSAFRARLMQRWGGRPHGPMAMHQLFQGKPSAPTKLAQAWAMAVAPWVQRNTVAHLRVLFEEGWGFEGVGLVKTTYDHVEVTEPVQFTSRGWMAAQMGSIHGVRDWLVVPGRLERMRQEARQHPHWWWALLDREGPIDDWLRHELKVLEDQGALQSDGQGNTYLHHLACRQSKTKQRLSMAQFRWMAGFGASAMRQANAAGVTPIGAVAMYRPEWAARWEAQHLKQAIAASRPRVRGQPKTAPALRRARL